MSQEGFKEGSKPKIHFDSLRTTVKITMIEKASIDGMHGFWLKNVASIYGKLAIEMIRRKEEKDIPE